MLTKDEIISLIKGEKKLDEVVNNNRVVLITWSGEDIKDELYRRKITASEKEVDDIIRETKKGLENCECSACIDIALDIAIKEVKG
jgi:hypothetical protein